MDQTVQPKIDAFFRKYKKHSYKKGEILVRADDEPQGTMYLTTGRVKAYTISRKGEEVIVNIFREGSFFPMSWAVSDSSNTYFYEALTEVELWRAPKNDVVVFLRTEPDVLFDLLRRVYIGVDGVLQRMSYLMGEDAYTRLIAELVITAKRFGEKTGDGAVELKISEKDLAAQTGLTRETVSREIKKLKDKNLVALHRDIVLIHSLSSLENELQEG